MLKAQIGVVYYSERGALVLQILSNDDVGEGK